MGYTIIHQTVKKSKKSEPAFRLTLIHSKQYYNLFDNTLTGGKYQLHLSANTYSKTNIINRTD